MSMSWLGGVVCVVGMGKRLIIHYYIALGQLVYRISFSVLLGFHGWYSVSLGIFCVLGVTGSGNTPLLYGIWSLPVCFGLFGESATTVSLRIWRVQIVN